MALQTGVFHTAGAGVLRFLILVVTSLVVALAFFLGGAAAEHGSPRGCSLCPDGGEIEFPNAPIPFYALPTADNPTCGDLAFLASMVPHDSIRCTEDLQLHAGYCGCPNVEQSNICSFCPDGDAPDRPDLTLLMGDTCESLYRYVSFFNQDQCNSLQYSKIIGNAYECGCDISVAKLRQADLAPLQKQHNCNLCADGSMPPDPDFYLELGQMTCGEYVDYAHSLNPRQCEIQSRRGTFALFAFQCMCPGAEPPACVKQENPELCTVSLLNSVDHDEKCECYSFCDGEFVGCDKYPGHFLGDKCSGTKISGCNYASAIVDVAPEPKPEPEPIDPDPNSCSICPDSSNNIGNPEAVLPPFSGITIPGLLEEPTCRDLIDHLGKKSKGDTECKVAQSRLSHLCGCDGAEPSCTLCPGGVPPSFASAMATVDETCEQFASTVLTWEADTCEGGESYLSVMAARCGCVTAEWPVCPVLRQPVLCTVNLLRSTDEVCECYNFCGSEFHSCADYPGRLLDESDCPEGAEAIAGCNMALATSQRCSRGSIGPPCDGYYEEVAQTKLRHNLRH